MQHSKAHGFLSPFRAFGADCKMNLLSQPGIQCKSGKWLVPDEKYNEFLDKYHEDLSINPTKKMHFLEMPSDKFNMIKVDVDLRFKATEEELKVRSNIRRRYTEKYIDILVKTIANNINEIIDVKNSFNIYIQEKTEPRIANENYVKDGIHIIIPDIVMSNTALFYLREQIIDSDELKQITKDIENTSDINDVIDKRIIYPNAWYIYGCGKPDDNGNYYKVTKIFKIFKKNEEIIIKKTQSDKTLFDFIKLFSNFDKIANVEYLIDFEEEDLSTKYKYSKETTFGLREKNNILRSHAQNQSNFRRTTSLSSEEIKPFLNCLKIQRVNDYTEWKRIGICLYNMDDRNFNIWCAWSSQSDKYNEDECYKVWFTDFKKCSKYNLGLNKLKEYAKNDNIEEYKKIININKTNFFTKWIYEHAKETHIKQLSTNTLSNFTKIYIKDYANFNIACACPGTSPIWYKYDNHKWTEDKAANKIYMLLTEELQREISTIHEDLKNKVFREQTDEQHRIESNRENTLANVSGANDDSDDEENLLSYQRYLTDDRATVDSIEEQKSKHLNNQHNKACLTKCGQILEFLSTPQNKKKIIEDLSQKCYDEEFYTNLDENRNAFVCNNGVLDLEQCCFRNGEPADMMTISSKINFPKDVESLEAQDIILSIQDWLDRIFPEDEVQDYVLNLFSLKLSGNLHKEWFHIFTGSGANGKSQWFKMINKVFGEYFKTFDNTLLNTPKRDANAASPAIASLKGCRVAVTTEPKGGQPFESDKVKELISGDELVGRHLNKDLIRFIPQYAMMMQCNDIPRNESTDDGFWRKIFIIPCPSKFVDKEEDLYKLNDPVKFPFHFRAENQEHLYTSWAPYFLYLLFERYKELKRCGFKFNVPDKVKIAIREYQEEASTYTQFFNEKIVEAPGYKIDSNTLYNEFQQFVGRDFKTQKTLFLKQMERFLGKPKGRNKEYYNFKIFGSSGDPIEAENADIDMD
jgi:P4 family phage/plasmid primase-like protien